MSTKSDRELLDELFDAQERWTTEERLAEEVYSLRQQLYLVMRRAPQEKAVRDKLITKFDDEIPGFFARFLAERKGRRRQFREFKSQLETAIAERDAAAAALAMSSFHHVLHTVKMNWDVIPYTIAGSRKTIETNKRRRQRTNAEIEAALKATGSVFAASIELDMTRQAIEKRITPERRQLLTGNKSSA